MGTTNSTSTAITGQRSGFLAWRENGWNCAGLPIHAGQTLELEGRDGWITVRIECHGGDRPLTACCEVRGTTFVRRLGVCDRLRWPYQEENTETRDRELPQAIRDLGQQRFRHLDLARAKVLHHFETADGYLYVIGDPANAGYEWVVVAETGPEGLVEVEHSDNGYGGLCAALRDGLDYVLGGRP
jgi:hypothetical protein